MIKLTELLFEAKKDIGLPTEDELSSGEKEQAYANLSAVEKSQLGTKNYIPFKDWPMFRKYMFNKSKHSNPGLDPELTAYTPGETVNLFHHPVISSWHDKIRNFLVPAKYKVVAFVPCAKTKPWEGCTTGIYGNYNKLRQEYGDLVYFVTISEPLGIVPQDLWGEFPQYDNPGLFKNAAQRSDMFTKDWERLYNVKSYLQTPFDESKYREAIQILGNVIKDFVNNNKTNRPSLKFISFVEDKEFKKISKGIVGSHSDMLNHADVIEPEHRYKKRGAPREAPYDYMKPIISKLKT
jgi:predicted RNA-binding protein